MRFRLASSICQDKWGRIYEEGAATNARFEATTVEETHDWEEEWAFVRALVGKRNKEKSVRELTPENEPWRDKSKRALTFGCNGFAGLSNMPFFSFMWFIIRDRCCYPSMKILMWFIIRDKCCYLSMKILINRDHVLEAEVLPVSVSCFINKSPLEPVDQVHTHSRCRIELLPHKNEHAKLKATLLFLHVILGLS
jgi:hypothetical protein